LAANSRPRRRTSCRFLIHVRQLQFEHSPGVGVHGAPPEQSRHSLSKLAMVRGAQRLFEWWFAALEADCCDQKDSIVPVKCQPAKCGIGMSFCMARIRTAHELICGQLVASLASCFAVPVRPQLIDWPNMPSLLSNTAFHKSESARTARS